MGWHGDIRTIRGRRWKPGHENSPTLTRITAKSNGWSDYHTIRITANVCSDERGQAQRKDLDPLSGENFK
jgi:hypothetical protein